MAYPHGMLDIRVGYTELSPSPIKDMYLTPCCCSHILNPSKMILASISDDEPLHFMKHWCSGGGVQLRLFALLQM